MKQPLLTIAIPTLNGERFLEETLRSAVVEVDRHGESEILIVDNASQDRTAAIAAEYQRRYPCVRVVTNPETVEVNRNLEIAVNEAQGRYVWLLADDDVITEGAVQAVVAEAVLHDPAVVLVSFSTVDEQLNGYSSLASIDPALEVLDNDTAPLNGHKAGEPVVSVFTSGDSALLATGFSVFGVLSAIVVRKADFIAEVALMDDPMPSNFDFLYLVPMLMLRRGPTVFIRRRLVLFRQYPKRWVTRDDYSQAMDNYFIVIPTILKRLELQGFLSQTIRPLIRRQLMTFSMHVRIAKGKGMAFDRGFVGNLIRVNYRQPLFWLQLPAVALPYWLLSPVPGFYRLARRLSQRSSSNATGSRLMRPR